MFTLQGYRRNIVVVIIATVWMLSSCCTVSPTIEETVTTLDEETYSSPDCSPFTPTDSVFSENRSTVSGWQGIVPGVTLMDEAITLLENSQYVRKESIVVMGNSVTSDGIVVRPIHWESCSWNPPSHTHGPQNTLYIIEDKVGTIRIRLDDENYLDFSMTVEQAIAHFGEPENVVRQIQRDEQGAFYNSIDLLYPTQGLALHCRGDSDGALVPESYVMAVYYYESMSVEELRLSPVGPLLLMNNLEQLESWNGYE